jgi:hypothetical protein
MQQVGLAQASVPIDEEGIVLRIPWRIGHSECGGMSKLVGLADYKIIEGLVWADTWNGVQGSAGLLPSRQRRRILSPGHMELDGDGMSYDLFKFGRQCRTIIVLNPVTIIAVGYLELYPIGRDL